MATLGASRLEVKSGYVLQGALSQSTSVKMIKDELYSLFSEIELKKTTTLPHSFFPEFTDVIKYENLLKEIGAGKDPVSLSGDSCSKKHDALRKVQAKRKAGVMGNASEDSEEEEEEDKPVIDKSAKKGCGGFRGNSKRNKKTRFSKNAKGGK